MHVTLNWTGNGPANPEIVQVDPVKYLKGLVAGARIHSSTYLGRTQKGRVGDWLRGLATATICFSTPSVFALSAQVTSLFFDRFLDGLVEGFLCLALVKSISLTHRSNFAFQVPLSDPIGNLTCILTSCGYGITTVNDPPAGAKDTKAMPSQHTHPTCRRIQGTAPGTP